jgi:hypothetical protein
MTAFWIAGAAINLVFFGALAWWAVRNWRRGTRPPDDRHDAR